MTGRSKDTPATSKVSINMLDTSTLEGPATYTHRKTYNPNNTTLPADVKPTSPIDKVNAPPPLMEDCKDTLQVV